MSSITVIPYVVACFKRVHENQEQLLLLYRSNTGFADNHYDLVGGKIDANESPQQALVREIKEEIGSHVEEKDATLSTLLYFKESSDKYYIAFVFTVTKWVGEPINKEPLKHDHIKWFNLDNLPKNFMPRHTRVIKQMQQGIIFADEGFNS